MKLQELVEANQLYVVTKNIGGWGTGGFRHGPMFIPGDEVYVLDVDDDGVATVSHEEGGAPSGYKIPMDKLAPAGSDVHQEITRKAQELEAQKAATRERRRQKRRERYQRTGR